MVVEMDIKFNQHESSIAIWYMIVSRWLHVITTRIHVYVII